MIALLATLFAALTLIAGALLLLMWRWPSVRDLFGRTAQIGDTVRIHYTGRLNDGSTFDSSEGQEPRRFTLGAGEVIPGLERAVQGMIVGEMKRVVVSPADSYGPKRDDLMAEVPRSRLPAGEVRAGDLIEIAGSPVLARVVELRGDTVLMDVNHPLAGEDLIFDITLLDLKRPRKA